MTFVQLLQFHSRQYTLEHTKYTLLHLYNVYLEIDVKNERMQYYNFCNIIIVLFYHTHLPFHKIEGKSA